MKKFVIAVVCIIVLSGLVVMTWTALSQDAQPAAAGDDILSIPACAFLEKEDDYDFERDNTLYLKSGSNAWFSAPVHLPHGSVIKKIRMICLSWSPDGSTSSLIKMKLYRGSMQTDVLWLPNSEKIASISANSYPGWYSYIQRLSSKNYVNNWKYSYYVAVYLPKEFSADSWMHAFFKAQIIYAPPAP